MTKKKSEKRQESTNEPSDDVEEEPGGITSDSLKKSRQDKTWPPSTLEKK